MSASRSVLRCVCVSISAGDDRPAGKVHVHRTRRHFDVTRGAHLNEAGVVDDERGVLDRDAAIAHDEPRALEHPGAGASRGLVWRRGRARRDRKNDEHHQARDEDCMARFGFHLGHRKPPHCLPRDFHFGRLDQDRIHRSPSRTARFLRHTFFQLPIPVGSGCVDAGTDWSPCFQGIPQTPLHTCGLSSPGGLRWTRRASACRDR